MNPPPPAAARPARTAPAASPLWRNLALVFAASSLALAILLVRVAGALDTLSAQAAAKAAAAGPASAASTNAASLPRELTPYAALGSNLAENNPIADLGWTPAQCDAFLAGLRAAYEGRGVPMDDEARRLRGQLRERGAARPAP